MTIAKREAELKAQFAVELRKRLPGFLSLRLVDAGDPDRAIVGMGRTSFWEFKHATPDFDSSDLQELTCMRLDVQCHCRYVIWQEQRGRRMPGANKVVRTLIVNPRRVHDRTSWDVQPEAWTEGFDHGWLVERIAEAHR